jgi:hypothetical protein
MRSRSVSVPRAEPGSSLVPPATVIVGKIDREFGIRPYRAGNRQRFGKARRDPVVRRSTRSDRGARWSG